MKFQKSFLMNLFSYRAATDKVIFIGDLNQGCRSGSWKRWKRL